LFLGALQGVFYLKGRIIMTHIFDVEIAKEYGVNAAILLQNLGYWIMRNKANETNYFDGRYWTFNSRKAYRELFPYMSERQIDTAFKKLIDNGLVITGNYNKLKYDRTLWYALTQKGECILHFDGMEEVKVWNGEGQNVEPIPDVNTNDNPNVTTKVEKATSRFTPPTAREVHDYCQEMGYHINEEKYISYYQSNGWKVGKNKMKDWKAAVRTWVQKDKEYNQRSKQGAKQQEKHEVTMEELAGDKLLPV
jgi:hypothetical protein